MPTARPKRSTSARRATITDVAARAGVGASTVSRVLNDGQVSPEAREKVLVAVRQLDYRPHSAARALASGPGRSTTAIGVVIPFFTSPSAVERLRGVLEVIQDSEHDLILCNVADPTQRDGYLARHAPLERVDGLLVISLAPRDEEVEAILAAGVSTVLVDAFHPGLPRIVIDDIRGGEVATRHLLELGHERIAFVGDDADPGFGFVSSHLRWSGYRHVMTQAGRPVDQSLRRLGPHGRESALRLTLELLSLSEPPTAIFAASDLQALGVLEAAAAFGLSVPEDLSVVGFDDLEVAPYVGLTTVAQSLHDSGRRGARWLLSMLEGGSRDPREEQIPLRLQVRRTTAPPRQR